MSRLHERLGQRTEHREGNTSAAAESPVVGVQPRAVPLADVQGAYEVARAEWLDALRASRDGGNRSLARLALAQQTYEAASVALERARGDDELERQRLEVLRRRRDETQRRAEAIANQSAAWDRVRGAEHGHPRRRAGLLGWLFGRRR